jgi:hypothetical protein
MLYESTKALLQDMLDSLEKQRKLEWDYQVESCYECLYQMHQMCRPRYRAYQTGASGKWPVYVPNSERLSRAIPHVKLMLAAIRRKSRAMARKSGNAALAEMNGIRQPQPASARRPGLKCSRSGR